MTDYSLRARTDGQTEVLENGLSVLGIFPEEQNARLFHRYLAGRFLVLTPPPAVEVQPAPAPASRQARPVVPGVVEADDAPVSVGERHPEFIHPRVQERSDRQAGVEAAVRPAEIVPSGPPKALVPVGRRPAQIRSVAPVMHRPDDLVARRRAQAVFARQGALTCRLCGKGFVPSLSEPETCARCTRTMER